MFRKKFFLVFSYFFTFSGVGYACWYLVQPKTIAEAISKLHTLSTTKEHFKRTYNKFKYDSTFNKDIGITSGLSLVASSSINSRVALLQSWCQEKLALSLTQENVKKVLPKAVEYCTLLDEKNIEPKRIVNGSSWAEITKLISEQGLEENSEVFLVATDYPAITVTTSRRGLQKRSYYCWDKLRNTWLVKGYGELCD